MPTPPTLAPAPLILAACAALALVGASPAQGSQPEPWDDARLVTALAPWQDGSLLAGLKQAELLAAEPAAWPAVRARLQGNHREYTLRIRRLLDQLADPRWSVREDAERRLVAMGGRAWGLIQEVAAAGESLEQRLRAARVLQGIRDRGSADEERELRFVRGLMFAARGLPREAGLTQALHSALGHPDRLVRRRCLLALREHGDRTTPDLLLELDPAVRKPAREIWWTVLARLCPAPGEPEGAAARAALSELWNDPDRMDLQALVLRELLTRPDLDAWRPSLPARFAAPVADWPAPPPAAPPGPQQVEVQLADGGMVAGRWSGCGGSGPLLVQLADGPDRFPLAWGECAEIQWTPAGTPSDRAAPPRVRGFLVQGSVLTASGVGVTSDTVLLADTVLGDLELPRVTVQGLSLDPTSTRLLGLSEQADGIRFAGAAEMTRGRVLGLDRDAIRWEGSGGAGTGGQAPVGIVESIAFQIAPDTRPPAAGARFTRLDTAAGDRLLGHVLAADRDHLLVVLPGLGATTLPVDRLRRLQAGVVGGAQWRFTLVADYAEGRLVEFDDRGREVFALTDVVGVWDAECLSNGNLLVTEFTASRVREFDREGQVVWEYRQVRNPYDADRLANGNTLIADTYGGRVVEVDPSGKVVWSMGDGIRPMDVDRLANGNTLIADANGKRILEVDPAGKEVWSQGGIDHPYDADRLTNGNTLVTLRDQDVVVEYRSDGTIAWRLEDLSSPSDADRLNNGNTLVAENGRVREFAPDGTVVATLPVVWAVEANRY